MVLDALRQVEDPVWYAVRSLTRWGRSESDRGVGRSTSSAAPQGDRSPEEPESDPCRDPLGFLVHALARFDDLDRRGLEV